MKISRRHGVVVLRLDALEAAVLGRMFDELLQALAPGALDAADPVRARLYPAGYERSDAAEEFRGLTEESLTTERVERIDRCLAELPDAAHGVRMDTDAGLRWIAALNDLRLAVGTRLGVSEDEADVAPDDPEAAHWAAYYWLTGLQDGLVQALMR